MIGDQQHEILDPAPLLDEKGCLSTHGYARSLLLHYDRTRIAARRSRIREWDRYLVFDNGFLIDIGIASNTHVGLCTVSYADLSQPWVKTVNMPVLFTHGSFELPASSWDGMFKYREGRLKVCIVVNRRERRLDFEMHDFEFGASLRAKLAMMDEPAESIVTAVPYAAAGKEFLYSQKIVGMRAQGTVSTAMGIHAFDPDEAFAVINRGRGVLPRKRARYWACACGICEGEVLGFNIGDGLGGDDSVTENMFFVDGIGHKLGTVDFSFEPGEEAAGSSLQVWRFSDVDGRFDMRFTPVVESIYKKNLLIVSGSQHRMFGHFNGTMTCDDGRVIRLDDCNGIMEKATSRF